MNLKWIVYGVILLSTCLFSACSALNALVDPDYSLTGQDRVTQVGAIQNINRDLEKVDLIRLLSQTSAPIPPSGVPALTPPKKDSASPEAGDPSASAPVTQYSTGPDEAYNSLAKLYAAYQTFYDSGRGSAGRNQIQDEILRASEQRCTVYKSYIRRTQSTSNFLFGSLATILGGLGAVFTDANVARSLAGSAGIMSGIGAEYQQAYFSNLATEVIIDGIETRRQRIRDTIASKRRNASLKVYTVQAAILDAVRYHGACTIVEGLREASQSIQTVRDPGLKAMNSTLRDYAVSRKMLDQIQKGEALTVSLDDPMATDRKLLGSWSMEREFPGSWDEDEIDSPAIAIQRVRTHATGFKDSLIKTIAGKKTEFKKNEKENAQFIEALDSLEKETTNAHKRLICKLTAYDLCDRKKNISDQLAEYTGQLQMLALDKTKQAAIQKDIVKLQYLANSHILIDLGENWQQFGDLMMVSQNAISALKVTDAELAKSITKIRGKIAGFMKDDPDGTDASKCTTPCP